MIASTIKIIKIIFQLFIRSYLLSSIRIIITSRLNHLLFIYQIIKFIIKIIQPRLRLVNQMFFHRKNPAFFSRLASQSLIFRSAPQSFIFRLYNFTSSLTSFSSSFLFSSYHYYVKQSFDILLFVFVFCFCFVCLLSLLLCTSTSISD